MSREIFINNDDNLKQHAPCKRTQICDDQIPFFDNELAKAIMKRTKLHKNFVQNKSGENSKPYAKQRNSRVSLLKKPKGDIMKT